MFGIQTYYKVARRWFEYKQGKRLPLVCCWLMTNKCPLSCKGCFFFERVNQGHKELSTEQMHRVLDRIIEARIPFLHIAGGEPLMRKDFFELMEKARRNRIVTILYTNGILLDEHAARLINRDCAMAFVSLDGKKEQHEILRGEGSYDKAILGLENLLSEKNRTRVGINYVITRHNADTTNEFLNTLLNMKLDLLKIHPHYFPDYRPTAQQVEPIVQKLLLIEKQTPGFLVGDAEYFTSWVDLIAKGQSTPCDVDTLLSLGILSDGRLSACSTFFSPLGNLLEHSFEDILSKPLEKELSIISDCDGCFRFDAPLIRYFFDTPLFSWSLKKVFQGLKT